MTYTNQTEIIKQFNGLQGSLFYLFEHHNTEAQANTTKQQTLKSVLSELGIGVF